MWRKESLNSVNKTLNMSRKLELAINQKTSLQPDVFVNFTSVTELNQAKSLHHYRFYRG